MNGTSNQGVNSTGIPNGANPVTPTPVTPVQMPQVNNAGPVSASVINNQVVGNANVSQTVSPQPVVSMPTPVQTAQPAIPQPVTQVPVAPTQPQVPVQPQPVQPVQSVPVQPVIPQPVVQAQPAVQTPVQPQGVIPQPPVSQPVSPMPIIPNVDDLIESAPVAQAPVQPQGVIPQPPASQPQVTEEDGPKVEMNLSSEINVDIDKKKKEKKVKKEKPVKKLDDEDDEEIGMHSNKAPVAMAIMFASIMILFFVYYFVIMTPQRVFDKAINSTFDSVKKVFTDVTENDSKVLLDLGFALDTDNELFLADTKDFNGATPGVKKQEPTDYIDNDYLRGKIYLDLKEKDIRIQLMSHKLLANLTQIYADPSDNTSCLAKYEGKNCGEKDENYSIEDKKFKIREDFEKVVVDGVRSISVYDQQGISAYDKNSKKIYTTMLDFNVFYFNPEEEKNNETNNSEKKSGLFIGPIEYLNYNNIPNNKYSVEIINEDGSTKIDRNVEGNPNSIKLKFNHVVNAKELLTGKDSDLDLSFLDNLNVDKITKASEVLEVIKDKILDYIDDEKLERGIAIKKVGGTSAVALKAHVNVEEDLIREIYRKVFVDFRNDTNNELNGNKIKIKDNLKEIFGWSDKEVQDEINSLLQHICVNEEGVFEPGSSKKEECRMYTKNVDVNLYMNLANTELISLDVNINNKYHIEISYLNGYYSINIDISSEDGKVLDENSKKMFQIKATYQRDVGIVDGYGILDTDKTYLAVKFDYERITNKKSDKTGNRLILGFYRDDSFKNEIESKRKPFAILNCDLTVYDSDNITEEENDKSKAADFELRRGEKVLVQNYNYESGESTEEEYEIIEKPKSVLRSAVLTNLDIFKEDFTHHVIYLVDHLLHNKEGQEGYRPESSKEEETSKNDNKDANQEDEKKSTTEEIETTDPNKETTEEETSSEEKIDEK